MSSFRSSSESVLRENDRGTYTVPSPSLYPHQWAWDSAFCAIGWAHLDPGRAWLELETLTAAQWPDGRVPHIVFHDLSGDYFPGPDFWGTERSSAITQPPLWATAARRIVEISGESPRLEALLSPFEASHRFFHAARDPLSWGVTCVVHPWESGLDNAPAWDLPLSRVDVSRAPAFRRRDKDVVGDASVRPTDAQYRAYATLVKAIAEDGYGPGPFAVYDPFMTSCLALAESDLAWLFERSGRAEEARAASARAEGLRRALAERLWDPGLGRFVYVDARAPGGPERISHDVIGGYAPLFCGIGEPFRSRLEAGLEARFSARFPLPSTSPSDPAFEPRRYWRGPSWVNVNWLFARALGGERGAALASSTLALIEKSGFREYYHPETGEPLGARDFAWTAALALDLLAG